MLSVCYLIKTTIGVTEMLSSMRLTIKRISMTPLGTYGVMLNQALIPFAVTAERPWLGNKINVSCIPAGLYTCRRIKSPKYGDTFEICDVEGRTDILFHKGNRVKDSKGCVLVAESFGTLHNQMAVLASKHGYDEFMDILEGIDEFELLIEEV